jgi:hypothetical protein
MMNMKKLIVAIFLILLIISPSFGQNVTVKSTLDSSKIFIGDQIKFNVLVDQPSDLRLILPVFKDTLCKNIEIISGPVVDSSVSKDGRIRITQKYLITSFDSGYYQIPPAFAEMKTDAGLKRFYSDYSQLRVMRVKIAPADTTLKIFDIIKPYKAPVTFGEVLPWALIAVVFAAFVWGAIRYIRKFRKAKAEPEIIINPDPAHIIALRELEKLKEEKLWEKGEIKNYYTRLTEILRQYLENRYKIYSLELTTGETLEALVKTGFKKDGTYNQLKTVLTGADLVKFAKYNPEPHENQTHYQSSLDFVLATKEDEVIPGEVKEEVKSVEGSL